MTARVGDWILTFSGVEFWPLDPRPSEVRIEDIAHALANVGRFTGHARTFLSVAQHSVLVARSVPPADALWGLLHDASEAYLADVASPIKNLPEMAPYREAEKRIMYAVCERFDLVAVEPQTVRDADGRMLATEARDLMPEHETWHRLPLAPYPNLVIKPWAPTLAEVTFLNEFRWIQEQAEMRAKASS